MQDVYRSVIRFKEVVPNWEAYDEAALPAHRRAILRYVGSASSVDSKIPVAIAGGPFSFALAYADPGRGAPPTASEGA